MAGDYYIYDCSSYGNTASAFTPYSNADHLSTANGCMQPAPGGGYRSLEINGAPGNKQPVAYGYGARWVAFSPSPAISIVGAYTPVNTVFVDCNLNSDGFTANYGWTTGSQNIVHENGCNSSGYGYGTGINAAFAPSSYFGWSVGCWLASSCSTSSSAGAVLGVQGVRLTVQENSGPSVSADGASNLWWYGGRWVRGGGWPVNFTASDPSGVCGTDLLLNGGFTQTALTEDSSPDTASFMQCWGTDTATGSIDTSSLANGPLTIEYAATNAANVVTGPSETLYVDNTPVQLALSTPNDTDPNVWVDHAVTLTATASAGPSGVSGTSCATNGGPSTAYPKGGITLNGTGVWKVSCTSSNNADDVNGQPATSPTQNVAVHIDETPPAVSFEPADPANPQMVVADTTDGQAGVASGQIAMRPAAGGSWQNLPTQFDGAHLIAQFNDATLASGAWQVQATSCDKAGNCASSDETVTLPVRTRSISSVSFQQVSDPLAPRIIKKREYLGWHWATVRRRGRLVRFKRGGHVKTVETTKYVGRCSHTRVRVGRHRWREKTICRKPGLVLKSAERVPFGQSVLVHGLLTTTSGLPIADARIELLTAPADGLSQYASAGTATTDANGAWTATLGAGPSRLISAVYAGAPTVEPSTGSATLSVPASVRVLKVWPRHVAWGHKVHIRARLVGGYLPSDGALVRLRLGYGKAKITYGVQEHVAGNGIFEVTNAFGPGPAAVVRHYWLQECTLPQGDYPFAPACGPRSGITVGG